MGIVRLFELCSSKPICVYSVPNKVEKCFNNSYYTFLFYILVVLNSITKNVLRHRSVNLKKILTLHKKMKFSIKDFFSKCDQIHWSHLLKKSLIENFIFLRSERAGEEDLYTLEDEKKRDKKVVE